MRDHARPRGVPSNFSSPEGLKTYPLRKRKSKVDVRKFGRPVKPQDTIRQFFGSLPEFLAAAEFMDFLRLTQKARKKGRSINFAFGAHVIKVGLGPILIDLMKEGWISALSTNGAGIIHDFEIAYCGLTSEEVKDGIRSGRFGMARETGLLLNQAVNAGAAEGLGLGDAVGRMIAESRFSHRRMSVLGSAARLGIPVTVHVAVGTDIIHFHPSASGEAIGQTSLRDFFVFCRTLEKMDGGGVFINAGSAVILPEVFLKAVSFVRNKGMKLDDFSTAVFDFARHYRPEQNVVRRPLGRKGRGFYFVGPHEIMIPLLAAGLKTLS